MIRVGKIVATHGLTGSLVMTHVLDNSIWLKKKHVLLLEMQKGSYIPYFVSNVRANGPKEYIIDLEDVDKIESAKKLVTKQVYVDESALSATKSETPLLWIGFLLIDKQNGELGTIEDVMQSGSQWIAKITYNKFEVLIPLVEEFIKQVDIKAKTIHVELPEGLLEVYSG